MKKSVLYVFMALSLLSCKGREESSNIESIESEITSQEPQIVIDAHTSENSLDWNGSYSGVLPCVDCEGIDTFITLHKDQTYQLKQRYLGNQDNEGKEFVYEGEFNWDENGRNITLEGAKGEFRKFKVGEKFLMPLDNNGTEINGIPGNNYKLLKH